MSDLHIFLDPPHMVKLVRNALFKYSTMYDRDGRQIQWKHFESLVGFGENNDFVSHKMTKKHLDVERCKMNVSVAAQTLSASVASSMKSLKKRGHTDFQECDGTIELAERVDKLFDILNSDVLRSNNVYKSPIMASTRKKIFDFLDDTVDYIKKLKFQPDGHYVVDSIRKVGFKGLIIDIASLKSLYCDLVETGKLVSLPVRKINQDPLESLFGRCRSYSVLGNNTNPTVQQFSAAFRKILVNNEITSPAFSNCDDSLDLLYVSSFRDKKMQQIAQIEHFECETNVENEPNAEDETIARDELDHALYDDQYMNDNVDYGITHTAGIIEKKIASFADFKCDLGCQNIFTENNKIAKKYFTKNKNSQRPCKSTYEICTIAYEKIQPVIKNLHFDYNAILQEILNLDFSKMYSSSNFIGHEDHKLLVIKYIIEEFISFQATYVAKTATLKYHIKKTNEKKIKHFKGQ